MVRRPWGARRLAGLVVASAVVGTLPGCWGQVGQGPDGRAHNPFETAITTGTVSDLEVAWTAPAGASSQPVATGTGVYVHTYRSTYGYAASDGTPLWAHTPPPDEFGGPRTALQPLVQGDRVMVPWQRGITPLTGGQWVDASTGEVEAEVEGAITSARGDWLLTEAVTANPDFSEYSFGVRNAADPDSGWGGTYFSGLGGLGNIRATLGRDKAYVAFGPNIDAYPLAEPPDHAPAPGEPWTKQFDWRVTLGDWVTKPVLSEDGSTLYVAASTGSAYALDAATGATLWSVDLGAPPRGTPAFDGTTLFVPTAADELVAVDVASAGVAWTAYAGGGHLQPAIAGQGPTGVVFVAVGGGTVAAYAAAGCGAPECPVLWFDDAGQEITGGPAVANGRLYVTTADDRLVAYGLGG